MEYNRRPLFSNILINCIVTFYPFLCSQHCSVNVCVFLLLCWIPWHGNQGFSMFWVFVRVFPFFPLFLRPPPPPLSLPLSFPTSSTPPPLPWSPRGSFPLGGAHGGLVSCGRGGRGAGLAGGWGGGDCGVWRWCSRMWDVARSWRVVITNYRR